MLSLLTTKVALFATVIVLALICAVTFLAYEGPLSGGDAMTLFGAILGGFIGVTAAHVGGSTAIAAGSSTSTVTTTSTPATGAPVALSVTSAPATTAMPGN